MFRDFLRENYSRYSYNDLLYLNNSETYFTFPKKFTLELDDNDYIHEVRPHEENRLDLIANLYYGIPTLWWVICSVNNIKDPLKVGIGEVLVVPQIEKIMGRF